MAPLDTVRKPSFIKLMLDPFDNGEMMSSMRIRDEVDRRVKKMTECLKNELQAASAVCTCFDIWSSTNRSFLGGSVHWIDSQSFERKSAGLMCSRFKGRHTYSSIRKAITKVHLDFKIFNKISHTITDNGSNFVKAFRRSEIDQENNASASIDQENNTSSVNDISDELVLTGHLSAGDLILYNENALSDEFYLNLPIIESDPIDAESSMPKHVRCFSHTLNLVAARDTCNSLNDETYKSLYSSAMKKAKTLWNLIGKSPLAAENAFHQLGVHLPRPVDTRWNSLFDAIIALLKCSNKLGKLNQTPSLTLNLTMTKRFSFYIEATCLALNIPRFSREELQFLDGYATVLRPLATALDILQGDQNCYLGYVLPALRKIYNTIFKINIPEVSPLKNAVLSGLDKRFSNYFDDEDFIVATCVHPKFKLKWFQSTDPSKAAEMELKRSAAKSLVHEVLMRTAAGNANHSSGTDTGKESEDFLSFEDEAPFRSSIYQLFLDDNDETLQGLTKHPEIKSLFLRFNTTIPSSAPVERMFSLANLVLTAKRNSLGDDIFEKLLLLKINGIPN